MNNIDLLPKTSGIYRIYNIKNGCSYIGQSKNIWKRIKYHHLCDYKNPNNSQYNCKIYQAVRNNNGWDNFEVEVLEECPIEELDVKEIYYIGQYDSFKHGYNSTQGGQYWSEKIHSLEVEQKREATRQKNGSFQNENHPRARLTNEEVIMVRQRYIDGESVKTIWQDWKDIYPNIDVFRNIILGKSYKTAGNIPSEKVKKSAQIKLSDEEIKQIRIEYASKKISYAKLGKKYNVSANTIQKIIWRVGYYSLVE